jgi:predicted TIM-barrel fold metal-dependent hydrolase
MDIVDGQLHVGRGKIDSTLEAMDALGIKSVIIDEYWDTGLGDKNPSHIQPGHELPNGAWRAAWPTATEAALRYPDRFAFLVRIDRLDPQLESVMRVVGSTPNALAFRLQPLWTKDEAAAFASFAYEPLFDIAQEIGLAVCLFIPGHVELLVPYLKKYPRLRFVVDHCGMGFAGLPSFRPEPEASFSTTPAYFERVLELAQFPNVALKWSHAQDRFGAPDYPYAPLRPYLRCAIEAFGANRLIWASDKTVLPHHRWSDMLHYLRDSPDLSRDEKEWILGRAARKIFNWPVAE